jgi:hypothetical protein
MSKMSNYLENKLINHIFRNITFDKPTSLAIALCTATPTDYSTGSTIVEVPNRNGYARASIDCNTTNWSATTSENGTTYNKSAITFAAPTGYWGIITSIAILDSATWGEGNLLFWSNIDTPQTINLGKTFSIPTQNLTIQLDN